jgi:hypothetical protein
LDDEEFEDEIFYSTDPIEIVVKALKKESIQYIALFRKRPLTHEDRERIAELQNLIKKFGVSCIFTYFYHL